MPASKRKNKQAKFSSGRNNWLKSTTKFQRVVTLVVFVVLFVTVGVFVRQHSEAATSGCFGGDYSISGSGYDSYGYCVEQAQEMVNGVHAYAIYSGGFNPWGSSKFLAHDKSFGPLTYAGVKDFQKFADIKDDGIVGQSTWSNLCYYTGSEFTDAASSSYPGYESLARQAANAVC